MTQRVAEALDRFRLIPYANLPPAMLGFGQRRQVALAAMIAAQPKALILDEPTGGLDWRSQQELMDIVANFNTLGRTVVLVTHDMRLVAEYATRAIVLLNGERLFDGTPRQLLSQPEILERAGLMLPPVTRLANRLSIYGMMPNASDPGRVCGRLAGTLARLQTPAEEGGPARGQGARRWWALASTSTCAAIRPSIGWIHA